MISTLDDPTTGPSIAFSLIPTYQQNLVVIDSKF